MAKSKFNPGPPFKNFTIAFTPDGTRHLHLVGLDRPPREIALPRSDGKEVSVQGMENAAATSNVQERTFHDIWKVNGKVTENVHGVARFTCAYNGQQSRWYQAAGRQKAGHPHVCGESVNSTCCFE